MRNPIRTARRGRNRPIFSSRRRRQAFAARRIAYRVAALARIVVLLAILVAVVACVYLILR